MAAYTCSKTVPLVGWVPLSQVVVLVIKVTVSCFWNPREAIQVVVNYSESAWETEGVSCNRYGGTGYESGGESREHCAQDLLLLTTTFHFLSNN